MSSDPRLETRPVENFDTGTPDILVRMVEWSPGEWRVQALDPLGNFTTFDADSQVGARMSGRFLADKIRQAIEKAGARSITNFRRRMNAARRKK